MAGVSLPLEAASNEFYESQRPDRFTPLMDVSLSERFLAARRPGWDWASRCFAADGL